MTENSAISAYFQRIGKLPLLTRDEEQELFHRIEQGDETARNTLIERNLKLVIPTAKRYMRCPGVAFADLVQEGSMAIAKACDKFDWRLGNKFSTYATYWIQQRIGRYVKKHSKNVFVPEHIVNLAVQINKVKRILAQKGIEPTERNLVAGLREHFRVKTDEKTVRETVEFCQSETSLFSKIGGDDGDTEFGELLEDAAAPDPAEDAGRRMVSEKLETVLRGLAETERDLVGLRYGIGLPAVRQPLGKLAAKFGTTVEELKRAARVALAKLGAEPSEIESLLAL